MKRAHSWTEGNGHNMTTDNTLNSTVITVGRLDIKGQIAGKTTMGVLDKLKR